MPKPPSLIPPANTESDDLGSWDDDTSKPYWKLWQKDDDGMSPEQIAAFKLLEEHHRKDMERIRQDQQRINQYERDNNLPVSNFKSPRWPNVMGYLLSLVYFGALGLAACGILWAIGGGMNAYFDHQDAAKQASGLNTFTGSGVLKVTAGSGGVYLTPCSGGGPTFQCLVDTGASSNDAVLSISLKDVKGFGIDASRLEWNGYVSQMLSGYRTAITTIPVLRVGPFTVNNAQIEVVDRSSMPPLLMAGWQRHYNINIRNNVMTISE